MNDKQWETKYSSYNSLPSSPCPARSQTVTFLASELAPIPSQKLVLRPLLILATVHHTRVCGGGDDGPRGYGGAVSGLTVMTTHV